MADDVTITFTADVSGLQQGMQQATSAVEATTSALRNGAAQINASFASLPQAYGSAAAKTEELASKSALRRLDIERNANQQIAADYRSSFEEIGSIVSSSIMGMITSHQSLKQTAIKILDQILSMFIKSQVKMVADWLAGQLAQTTATTTSQTAQTAAVTAGVAARTGAESAGSAASSAATISSVLHSIMASAGETFAGIFGFLSPVMGPAAAGPAAAGEATVLSVATGMTSFATGAWSLPSDMIAQVHQGEMIVPAGPAATFRGRMESNSGVAGTVHVHHSTNFNVAAMDSQSVRQFFKDHGRTIMRAINESVRTGSHIGLSKLGTP